MVVGECGRLGVAMAAVALAHGLNANMLRKWVRESEGQDVAPPAAVAEELRRPVPGFVPLALPAARVEGDIRIELQRAGTTVKIVWPAAASRDCAAWLSDWLR